MAEVKEAFFYIRTSSPLYTPQTTQQGHRSYTPPQRQMASQQQGQLQHQNGQVASSSNSSGQQQQQENTGQHETQDPQFAKLQLAAQLLSSRADLDARIEQASELSEVLNSSSSGDYVSPHNAAWQPFTRTRTVNLPDALFEEYDLLQCRCYMGLFPEIERAWITVDHRLFLWDYEDGSSFTSFEELQEVIVAVALVRPKPGIFIETITHLLILSTPLAVHIIGLSYIPPAASKTGKASFQLYMLDLTIPTGEGRSLMSIVGTHNGRIFGCSTAASSSGSSAGAGDLYEIMYNAKEGLFSKKCYLQNLSNASSGVDWVLPSFMRSGSSATDSHVMQVVVDKERELLYTRLRNNSIELWNIQRGRAAEKVATAKDIKRLAGMLCPGTPLINSNNIPFEIVAMETIPSKEGKGIGLLCVTSTGVRLYFTNQRGGLRGYGPSQSNPTNPPQVLELVHVRLPPKLNSDNNSAYNQNSITSISVASIPSNGGYFFLSANTVADDSDILQLFANDIGRLANNVLSGSQLSLMEVAGSIPIEGRTWAIAENSKSNTLYPCNELKYEMQSTSLQGGKRDFLFLTNMGMHTVARQRPVDCLMTLLETAPGAGRDAELANFANAFGRDQTCAMLLALLSGSSAVLAGNPAGTSSLTTEAVNTARRALTELGGRPVVIQRGVQVPNGAPTAQDGKIFLSGRHEAFSIYFARLIAPLLGSKIVVPAPSPQAPARVDSAIPDSTLMKIQRDLNGLRTFLEADFSHLYGMLADQWSGQSDIDAYQAEMDSVNALRLLLTQAIEAISFILLLIDYRLPDVVASCQPETARSLTQMSYADLLTTNSGRDIARSLVSTIINMQIGQNLSVDAISDVLQQRCGSFCSADDVLLYKAIENIRKAKSGPPQEKLPSLRESLRLFQKAALHLSGSRLGEVISEYNALQYQLGSVELAITCANVWDSEERGLSWWRDGQPRNDSRAPSWEPRNFCYEKILESLQSSDELLNSAVEQGSKSSIPSEEADSLRRNAYARALALPDEALQYKLYDWLIERGMTDQLLEVRNDFIEPYLLQEPATLERYDLLWQYYARHYQNGNAARVLSTLADSAEFGLSLNKRLEYLSLASSNAKSQFPNPSMRQDIITFLTEIDEKLEVGSVQVEIYQQVEELMDLEDQQRSSLLRRLDERLYSITELYAEFAQPLNLLEIILVIFHVSDHRDEEEVANTWSQLITQVQKEAGTPAETVDVLSNKLMSLTRRFYPSDVALPLPIIISQLEEFALEDLKQETPSSGINDDQMWIVNSLHEGGVPWQVLYEHYDMLFKERLAPFDSPTTLAHLLPSIVCILNSWLREVVHKGYSNTYGIFPANRVEEAIGVYLGDASLDVNEQSRACRQRLQDILREVRRCF